MTHADFKDQKPELLVPVEIKEWNHHLPSFVKKMQSWEISSWYHIWVPRYIVANIT